VFLCVISVSGGGFACPICVFANSGSASRLHQCEANVRS
jgi:hypothetical protein